MNVLINMENLEEKIKEALSININNVVKEQIAETVSEHINGNYKNVIESTVNEAMTANVIEYINSATIIVGGGFYSSEEPKEYTVGEYIKKQLGDMLQEKSLKVKSSSGYENYEMITFEDFIKREVNIDKVSSTALNSFFKDVRVQLNDRMTELFNDATKNMLSDTVFNVLMQNDTYKALQSGMKCIADGDTK
jgi:hypothetical protein